MNSGIPSTCLTLSRARVAVLMARSCALDTSCTRTPTCYQKTRRFSRQVTSFRPSGRKGTGEGKSAIWILGNETMTKHVFLINEKGDAAKNRMSLVLKHKGAVDQ